VNNVKQSEAIRRYVQSRLIYLQSIAGMGSGKAELARLRRGTGKSPGELPELWGIFLEDLPTGLQGTGKQPGRSEWSVYTVLTLYAVHQQGQNQSMYLEGNTLGKAIRQLVPTADQDAEMRVLRRFNQMATSSDMLELSYHLRGIIELLRSESIPLDYVDLAEDLYWYQDEERRTSVRLKWGRAYYQFKQNEKEEKSDE
jgi:CRISPR system Cascade subunit CasB